jgi:superfamily II DNA or RNA helicase
MSIRRWQRECIEQALKQYQAGSVHYLCLATPGAGKTRMASLLAQRLFDLNLIDLVVCFSPSTIVATDFREELQHQCGASMDGLIGAKGCSLTYQAMLNLPKSFWELFERKRIFVIFDEIHHCAGQTLEQANAWGQRIISNIQGKAAFTIALTGTPWRSDKVPIALANYCKQDTIYCDYQYGLKEAIKDGVCRIPKITIIDNDSITVQSGTETSQFTSFGDALRLSNCTYLQILENEQLIEFLLKQGNAQLNKTRLSDASAGGLIVAATVEHACKVHSILLNSTGENALIATYKQDEPHNVINNFRDSAQKWIIAVGMISEGTNIPRLRVCCHLTHVKTELHFRQVLGRILRAQPRDRSNSYFFMPAEPSLVDYAKRVEQDIPESGVVNFTQMPPKIIETSANANDMDSTAFDISLHNEVDIVAVNASPNQKNEISDHLDLTSPALCDKAVSVFGRFKRELLQIKWPDQSQIL